MKSNIKQETEKMKTIYEQIAKQYGVDACEVEQEITAALEAARALDLPQARDFWKNIPNCPFKRRIPKRNQRDYPRSFKEP